MIDGVDVSQVVEQLKEAGDPVDPNTLVLWVLRESYLQTEEDLRQYAEKVKYYNSLKQAERTAQLRDLLCALGTDLNSLCELRELDRLALQLIVDRLSKLMPVLAASLSDGS
jgi:hypothetical protein